MVKKGYIPAKGDFIALTFDTQSCHEQKGRRPALVISNTLFNKSTGLAFVCPIIFTDRTYPFHIQIPKDTSSVQGFVMVDQTKSIDYTTRKAVFIETASDALVNDALAILDACLY